MVEEKMNRIDELNEKMDLCKHGRQPKICWMCQEEDYDKRHRLLVTGAICFALLSVALFGFTASCNGAEISGGNRPDTARPEIRGSALVNVAARPLGVQSADLGRGAESLISDRFLDALALVESGNNPRAVGKRGELGAYQFGRAAWLDSAKLSLAGSNGITQSRPFPARAVKIMASASRFDLAESRARARAYCLWLEAQLTRALRRRPTAGEVYAAYNLGPTGFERCGNKLPRCPRSTRNAAKRLEGML